jgi:apolipoprotein N-acyltransferase
MSGKADNRQPELGLSPALLLGGCALVAFDLACAVPQLSFLIVFYLWCLFELARLRTGRQAFYSGLIVGFATAASQLFFFWNIFGAAAIALWMVLAFWMGLFVALARFCRLNFNRMAACILIPLVWTGLEYFRSELYYLRFSWLTTGFVLSDARSWLPFHLLGVYGMGFVLMAVVSLSSLLPAKRRFWIGGGVMALLALLTNAPETKTPAPAESTANLVVAGVQLEFPDEHDVLSSLNHLIRAHPEAQLLVLSEYTFDGPVPNAIRDWCRDKRKYLIVGGKEEAPPAQYYNTAFIVGTSGDILFRQAKSVPIQFFKDGLPARQQRLWQSPWGPIGICICYDLSYTRVTDALVRLGARAIIVPTMDVADWGAHQHGLHARVAPVRAAEYGIPIFRLASSGISQCVDASGHVVATAPFPGTDSMIAGTLDLRQPGGLPWDRVLGPAAVCVALLIACRAVWASFRNSKRDKPNPPAVASRQQDCHGGHEHS